MKYKYIFIAGRVVRNEVENFRDYHIDVFCHSYPSFNSVFFVEIEPRNARWVLYPWAICPQLILIALKIPSSTELQCLVMSISSFVPQPVSWSWHFRSIGQLSINFSFEFIVTVLPLLKLDVQGYTLFPSDVGFPCWSRCFCLLFVFPLCTYSWQSMRNMQMSYLYLELHWCFLLLDQTNLKGGCKGNTLNVYTPPHFKIPPMLPFSTKTLSQLFPWCVICMSLSFFWALHYFQG